jgi:hypothetical protein
MTGTESNAVRRILGEIAELLEAGRGNRHGDWAASIARNALDGPEAALEPFLVSNELWGGAGSIADEYFVDDRDRRRPLEERLIDLGHLQMDMGKTNVRTGSWVSTFEQWRRSGI